MSSKMTLKWVREMSGSNSRGSVVIVILSTKGRSSIFKVKRMSSLSSTMSIFPRFIILKVKFKMCGYRALFRTCTKIGKVFEKEVYGSVHLVYDIVQFCEMILCLSK